MVMAQPLVGPGLGREDLSGKRYLHTLAPLPPSKGASYGPAWSSTPQQQQQPQCQQQGYAMEKEASCGQQHGRRGIGSCCSLTASSWWLAQPSGAPGTLRNASGGPRQRQRASIMQQLLWALLLLISLSSEPVSGQGGGGGGGSSTILCTT